MHDARIQSAVELVWDDFTKAGFIERVNLLDTQKLAAFLGEEAAVDRLEMARGMLDRHRERYPLLNEVVQRWAQLKKARGFGPEAAQEWVDAVRVIDYARSRVEATAVDMPLRVPSAKLFNDSKRIEKLAAPIDALLVGHLDPTGREPSEIWQELGLFREEQPIRLAGLVVVRRDRVTDYLDTPYSGFAAATIRALETVPSAVLSIENQTNFHMEARARCDEDVLLIYTAGMPSPAWRAMYTTLLRCVPVGVPVQHWGDVDEGGFRIAASIAREAASVGHTLEPRRMHPNEVPAELRRPAREATVRRMVHFATMARWVELAEAVAGARFTVEQEGLT